MCTVEKTEEELSALLDFLFDEETMKRVAQNRIHGAGRKGGTLRPGGNTPLWNRLRNMAKPRLLIHGEQARLARLLGLHRQAINAYFTCGSRMPDAERTLMILAWLSSQNLEFQGKEEAANNK